MQRSSGVLSREKEATTIDKEIHAKISNVFVNVFVYVVAHYRGVVEEY